MHNSEEIEGYIGLIGHKVFKESLKPFKSGNKHNTVSGIIEHPQLKIPAFTFIDDDSYVECRRCIGVASKEGIDFTFINDTTQKGINKALLILMLNGMGFSIIIIKIILDLINGKF